MKLEHVWLMLGAVSCALPPIDYSGKACPEGACPAGYRCVEERCYREGEEPQPPDSGAPDGGTDGGADAGPGPLAPPDSLEAVVGPRSGVITLEWPEVLAPKDGAERISGYRVLWGPSGGNYLEKKDVQKAAACAAQLCRANLEGLPDNARVFAEVRSIDGQGNQSAPPNSPAISATPINGAWTNGGGWTSFSECSAPPSFSGGEMSFDQSSPDGGECVSLALAGDLLWRDFTLDAELKMGPGTYEAGVGFRATPSGYLILTVAHWGSDRAATVGIGQVTGLNQRGGSLAASVARLDPGLWHALRIVGTGPTVSVSLGPSAGSLAEVLRWSAPDGGASSGAFGLGLFTQDESGGAAFRRLKIGTRTSLPPRGPRRSAFDFDGGIPAQWRVLAPGSAVIRGVPCPSYLGARACDAGECPAAGSSCLEIDNSAASAPNEAAAGFDLPVGIDPAADFRVRFKFAVQDAGMDPKLLSSQQGPMVYSVGPDWAQNLQAMERNLGQKAAANQWHSIELLLQPSARQFAITWNGQSATFVPYPPTASGEDWSPHLGPLWLGAVPGHSTGRVHAYFTDVEVEQP